MARTLGTVNGVREKERDREPVYLPPSIPHQLDKIRKQDVKLRAALLAAPYHPTRNPIGAPPLPVEWRADPRCDSCKLGDHDKCVGVKCYGCVDPRHNRGSKGMGVNSGTRKGLDPFPKEWQHGGASGHTFRGLSEAHAAAAS